MSTAMLAVRRLLIATVLVAALGGCAGSGSEPDGAVDDQSDPAGETAATDPTDPTTSVVATSAPTSTRSSVGPTTTITTTATAVVDGCVGGWTNPAPDSELHQWPLGAIRAQLETTSDLVAVDMRYFAGPEAPSITFPRPPVVERWYVKGSLADDPSVRGRWILERRDAARQGIAAVARFDSSGFRSPDWRSFYGDGVPVPQPGLPGLWPGRGYDYVTGHGDTDLPGFPPENMTCLDGT